MLSIWRSSPLKAVGITCASLYGSYILGYSIGRTIQCDTYNRESQVHIKQPNGTEMHHVYRGGIKGVIANFLLDMGDATNYPFRYIASKMYDDVYWTHTDPDNKGDQPKAV